MLKADGLAAGKGVTVCADLVTAESAIREGHQEAQLAYAASDVLYLHALKEKLEQRLMREGRAELAAACFAFLPARARLDLAGWGEEDIFAH